MTCSRGEKAKPVCLHISATIGDLARSSSLVLACGINTRTGDLDPYTKATRWAIDMVLQPLRIMPQRIYFDVGVSVYPQGEYQLLWNHAAEIEIRPSPETEAFAPNSLLWTPSRVTATPLER